MLCVCTAQTHLNPPKESCDHPQKKTHLEHMFRIKDICGERSPWVKKMGGKSMVVGVNPPTHHRTAQGELFPVPKDIFETFFSFPRLGRVIWVPVAPPPPKDACIVRRGCVEGKCTKRGMVTCLLRAPFFCFCCPDRFEAITPEAWKPRRSRSQESDGGGQRTRILTARIFMRCVLQFGANQFRKTLLFKPLCNQFLFFFAL